MVRLVALFLLIGMLVSRADDSREYILLSGGPSLQEWEKFKAEPHDLWWGNFIRSARVRIQEIQSKLGPGAKITWLVHKPSYLRRASRQEKQDLITIRTTFLFSEQNFGAVVVHGHTPTPTRQPVIKANRIALDTGAVYGGKLTCAVLEGTTIRFLFA